MTIYDTLKNYFHLLLSVTDEKVLDLDSNNRLILVGYNTDVNTLYEILNANLLKERILSLKEIETYGLHKLISHWAMKELISKTNGNITMMKIAINVLYNTYNPRDIDDNVLLNTLSKRVSVDSEIVRQTFGKRTLYIK